MKTMTGRERVLAVLRREMPDRVVVCPNIWQWFTCHKARNTLPAELADCTDQVDAMKKLGFDICSRNVGGSPTLSYKQTKIVDEPDGVQRMITPIGELRLQTRFSEDAFSAYTVEHCVKTEADLKIYQAMVEDSEVHFNQQGYEAVRARVGDDGVVMVPFLQSPLKLLHIIAGQDTACLLLADAPEACEALFDAHTQRALRFADECRHAPAEVFMTMDNLDTPFHPPNLLRRHCVQFYRAVGDRLRAGGKLLFSHACGQLRKIMPEIHEAGLDGMEGIAPPPLGDLAIRDSLAISDTFIANGGMTVHTLEPDGPGAARRIDDYTRDLIGSVRSHANRFLFSSGCNTSIATPLDNLKYWRDAAWKYGSL